MDVFRLWSFSLASVVGVASQQDIIFYLLFVRIECT